MDVDTNAAGGAPAAQSAAPQSAKPWHDKLMAYKEKFSKWHDKCRNTANFYSKEKRTENADREYSIFWANIEVLKPAVYAKVPAPVVAPRFKDSDPIAREASEVLERSIVTTFEQSDLDDLLREARDEFLLYSRGTAWVRLSESERVEYDHVNYDDFAHDPARKWREVKWVARRNWLTRKEGQERFGEAFDGVPLKKRDEDEKKADQYPVWEIWCKASGAVYWVNDEAPEVLDEQPPLFSLNSFWPCPRPMFGTVQPKSLVPVPEITQYKDQIEEINQYTTRIALLADAMRAVGFYAAGQSDVSTAIEAAFKSTDDRAKLIPISSFAALGGGSLKDSVIWWPVDQVLLLVKELVALRRVVIDDVYQITGISDIVRGDTNANETAAAQQLKSQWGSQRIRERQQEIARFARDITRITGELLAENVTAETLKQMSQSTLPSAEQKAQAQAMADQAQQMQQPLPDQITAMLKKPSFEEVSEFLANDRARGFVIEIETDSTIQPDEDAEKQRRIEFVTSVGGLVQQIAPLVMQAPQMGPMAIEIMKFAAAGFRAGRPLEAAMDEFGEQIRLMAEKSQQPQEPVPDPAIELKKAELQIKQAESQSKLEFEQQRHAQTMEFEREKHGQEMQFKQSDLLAKQEDARVRSEMDMMRSQDELQFKRETEANRLADVKEGREATLTATNKPLVQLDAGEAMETAAQALQQMATDQSQAMATAVEALVNAVERLGGPRKKSIRGPKGQTYEMIDEAV